MPIGPDEYVMLPAIAVPSAAPVSSKLAVAILTPNAPMPSLTPKAVACGSESAPAPASASVTVP